MMGSLSLKSPAYIIVARANCLRLLEQAVTFARHLARDNAGNNNEARIAMIAMTTSNSIRVKANSRPLRLRGGRPNNTSFASASRTRHFRESSGKDERRRRGAP